MALRSADSLESVDIGPSTTSGDKVIVNVLRAIIGIACLLAFVTIEFVKLTFSTIANTLYFFIRFGLLFLIPLYMQGLRHETPLNSGVILSVQAVATLAILPIGAMVDSKRRAEDRFDRRFARLCRKCSTDEALGIGHSTLDGHRNYGRIRMRCGSHSTITRRRNVTDRLGPT